MDLEHTPYDKTRFKCGKFFTTLTADGRCKECGQHLEIIIRPKPQ